MNCDSAQFLVWRDLDGEATEADRRELLAHVQVCAACREFRATAASMHSELGSALAVERRTAPRTAVPSLPARSRTLVRLAWSCSLAAAALVALWIGRYGLPGDRPEVPPEGPAVVQDHVLRPETDFVLAGPPALGELPGGRGRIAFSPAADADLDAGGVLLRTGGCYLEVTPGLGPFEVRAAGVVVRVLGTRFGVEIVEQGVRVRVSEGRVMVESAGQQRVLLPGDEVLANSGDIRDGGASEWTWVPEELSSEEVQEETVRPGKPADVEAAQPYVPAPPQPAEGGGDLPPEIDRK